MSTHVNEWLDTEWNEYASVKWSERGAERAHHDCVVGEGPTTWHDWAGNYIKRAAMFGLDSPQGRQALGKDVCEQVQLPDDDAAAELLELAARSVVDGILPAEPMLAGAREPWRTVLIKTAAHLRGEEHAP